MCSAQAAQRRSRTRSSVVAIADLGRSGAVQRQGSEHGPKAIGLGSLLEAALLEGRRQGPCAVLAGLLEAVEDANLPEQKRHQRIARPSPVGNVELAAWLQDSRDLTRGPALVLPGEVVEEQRRQDDVERAVLIGHIRREALVVSDHGLRILGLGSSAFENLGIAVEADDLRLGMSPLGVDRQGPRTAAEIENVLAGPQVGLAKEALLEIALAGRQSNDGVVDPRQAAKAQRRDVPGIGHRSSSMRVSMGRGLGRRRPAADVLLRICLELLAAGL